MTDLLAARLQMAISLGFHIVFAAIGIAMPFLMAISHHLWIKKKDPEYLSLTKAWSKGVAIFFAVGAVSGTVLSFELGLLWPEFMKHAGPIIGMPFSLEGTAFFLEAIALGLFLYGWDKLSPTTHWLCGLAVGLCGVISGLFVICANGWMNSPSGFDWVNGEAQNIRPMEAMFNASSLWQGLHMTVAAFQATTCAVAGIHALIILKGDKSKVHFYALKISLALFAVSSLIQPILGDFVAKNVAKVQPVKLAAMESHFKTQKGAPIIIGGIPDTEKNEVHYGIEIPKLLSFLAYGDFSAEVKGLLDFPREEWPPVLIVHIAFQIMIAVGSLMVLSALGFIWILWKKPELLKNSKILSFISICTPLGFIAIEAGWIVTEVGRQPWIIYGIMKTKDAVTPTPGIVISLIITSVIYLMLTFIVFNLMRRQIRALSESAKS